MTAHQTTLRVRVRTAWWLPLYVRFLAAWCRLTRTEPDYEQIRSIVARGIRTSIEG
ncbi:hypothetical protein [Burkholderia pyrrocinia]|uniref:hypothetical protein n=1 Tax=Burkholderia pyrrocinia TaxID=60550 RepID=UPI002AB28560|nr:hypothetical protein [Burkholderia pyrrocinia]